MAGRGRRVVTLGYQAQQDLRRFGWPSDDRELGGCLYGHRPTDGGFYVARARPNPMGPDRPEGTTIEFRELLEHERFGDPRNRWSYSQRIIGAVHNHPIPGDSGALSGNDIRAAATFAEFLARKDPTARSVEIIATAPELWQGGYPSGRCDWDDPEWHIYLVDARGNWERAAVLLEEGWEWRFQVRQGAFTDLELGIAGRKSDVDKGDLDRADLAEHLAYEEALEGR